MKYKNIGLIALGALLSFSSCEKDADSDNETGVVRLESFYAVMDGDTQDDLKSYQQGCYDIHGMHNKWNDNDRAYLLCVDAAIKNNFKYVDEGDYIMTGYSNGAVDTTVVFKPTIAKQALAITGAEPYALATHNCQWHIRDRWDSNIYAEFTISDFQIYSDSIENKMPMMAIHGPFWENSEAKQEIPQNITFTFENLASLIRFDVTPDHNDHEKEINRIIVKGKGISGSGMAHYNEHLKLVTEWNGNIDQITLFCNKGTERKGVLSYVMVVPPLNNVPLEIEIIDNKNNKKILKGNVTIDRSTFKKVAINLADF